MSVTAVRIATFICFITAFAVLSACGGKEEGSAKFPSLLPTPTPDPSVPGSNAVAFTLEATFKTEGAVSKLHENSSWTSVCSVAKNEPDPAKRDIRCTLEVNELDLWFSDFTLKMGVPAGICRYTRVAPYWFFGGEPGDGPTTFSYTRNTTTGAISSLAGANISVYGSGTSQGVKCNFDYSKDEIEPRGPNCCMGSYTATVTNTDGVDPTKNTTVTTVGNWGGKWGNCAAGVGSQKEFARTLASNLPRPTIYNTIQGADLEVKAISPGNQTPYVLATNLWVSNYLDPATTVPQSMINTTLLTGYTFGNRYYNFECLDDAEEVISRIRMEVREWNLYSEYLKGAAGNPNSSGTETTGHPINDTFDWNDFLADPVAFPNGYPGLFL